jgi:ABC-2 type transport system ATP-binding protein
MDTILEARDLTKHYEDFSLREVSLTVRRGSIAGVFGANGAGKSTLMKVLAHQAPPHSGTVRVFGASYAEAEQDIKNRVGYVPQESVFYPDRTVQWVARFAAPYFARWNGAGFYKLLDEFKVNPLKKVKHLSGGQRNLLALAMALSHEAELLVLDEPTAGLDIVHRRSLLDRLRAFVAGGDKTAIVASHVTDGLDEIADEVWFLDEGRVVAHEDKDDLLSKWKWIHFKEGALPQAIEERLVRLRRLPFAISGLTGDYAGLRNALAEPLARGDARVENASLEDILLSYITKGA